MQWPMAFHVKSGYTLDFNDPSCLEYDHIPLEDTWKAMEKLANAGLARSIGISNFNKRQVDRILKNSRIPPAVNQVEVNLHWLNTKLINYCHSKNIQIEGYAPFRSPGFRNIIGSKEKSLLEEPNVLEIAKKHNKTPAQVLLRHSIQRGIVLLFKSMTEERLKANLQIMDFELSETDVELLNKTGINQRLGSFKIFAKHPEFPLADEY